jgi:hypothetical protein
LRAKNRGACRAEAFGEGGPYLGRATSRQGSIADSTITLTVSFDAPFLRSTNVIGTSPHRNPAFDASQASSTMKA